MELSEQDGTTLHLTLTQSIPRAMPGPLLASPLSSSHHQPPHSQLAGTQDSNMVLCGGGGSLPDASQGFPPTQATGSSTQNGEQQCVVVEHVLTLEFEPGGSALLRDAGLSPAVVDISEDVRAARAAQGASGPDAAALRARALADLVVDVKARVRRHCRRQLLLEGACGGGGRVPCWHVTWTPWGQYLWKGLASQCASCVLGHHNLDFRQQTVLTRPVHGMVLLRRGPGALPAAAHQRRARRAALRAAQQGGGGGAGAARLAGRARHAAGAGAAAGAQAVPGGKGKSRGRPPSLPGWGLDLQGTCATRCVIGLLCATCETMLTLEQGLRYVLKCWGLCAVLPQDLAPLVGGLQAELQAAGEGPAGQGAGEARLGARWLSLRGLLDWVDQRLERELAQQQQQRTG